MIFVYQIEIFENIQFSATIGNIDNMILLNTVSRGVSVESILDNIEHV